MAAEIKSSRLYDSVKLNAIGYAKRLAPLHGLFQIRQDGAICFVGNDLYGKRAILS